MIFKTQLTFVLILFFPFVLNAQDYRYTENNFASTEITENITYGTAPFLNAPYTVESYTTIDDLKMDIYLPQGDTNTKRPAIIFAHSGGFIIGHKNHDDMMALCDLFAKKGYVTATIDYRQGFSLVDNPNTHGTRAVYRGIQDGRTAVRYMRANANNYGIDANKVYFVGSSAGAFIALHSIYLNETEEIPPETGIVDYLNTTYPFSHTTPDLGGLDIGENLGYNGEPDAVVSLWGAVQNTDLITTSDTQPIFLVHGTGDVIVPFETGSPFSHPMLNTVYGSTLINDRLDDLGFTNKETYFVQDEGHEFYGVTNGVWTNGTGGNEHWNIITEKITHFLWKLHKPTANFEHSTNGLNVNFTNTSIDANSWLWDFGDGTTSTEQNPSHTYAESGNYAVKLYIENDILSWDEKTSNVTVNNLSVNDVQAIDFNYYPNPTRDFLYLELKKSYPQIKVEIFSLSGRLIRSAEFFNTKKVKINLKNLPQNTYIIKVKKGNTTSLLKVLKN
ncbi:MAG: hypothetical protein CSA38_00630 [Flavobacteriales bacterium]|nr:MAG: hypothetical protein CSA38_00630 [Flavobacteriales bacterium]